MKALHRALGHTAAIRFHKEAENGAFPATSFPSGTLQSTNHSDAGREAPSFRESSTLDWLFQDPWHIVLRQDKAHGGPTDAPSTLPFRVSLRSPLPTTRWESCWQARSVYPTIGPASNPAGLLVFQELAPGCSHHLCARQCPRDVLRKRCHWPRFNTSLARSIDAGFGVT